MHVFDVEYVICQIQQGAFSAGVKSHRRAGGDPKLSIADVPTGVQWTLFNLGQGVPETVAGEARVDRVDFYILVPDLKKILPMFPPAGASHDPALRLPPRDSTGTERAGGKNVQMLTPICRFHPITSVRLDCQQPPSFVATASDATLHLDMEFGPKKMYGVEMPEVHLGIDAVYAINPGAPGPSRVELIMSRRMYATILRELQVAVR